MYEDRIQAIKEKVRREQMSEEQKQQQYAEQLQLEKYKVMDITCRIKGLIELIETCRALGVYQYPESSKFKFNVSRAINKLQIQYIHGSVVMTYDPFGTENIEFVYYNTQQPVDDSLNDKLIPVVQDFRDEFPAYEKEFLDWFDEYAEFKEA